MEQSYNNKHQLMDYLINCMSLSRKKGSLWYMYRLLWSESVCTCCIQPNYCIVLLGFQKILGKLVVKYKKVCLKTRSINDVSNGVYAMFLCFFFFLFSLWKHMLWVLIWIASTSWCNSNEYPQHMHIQEVKNTGCNLKTMKLLVCALIGICAVIRPNTVCTA